MLRIGLTGGIGSGKTTVAQIFEALTIPVYYADEAARTLMNSDAGLRKKIIEVFGEEAYPQGILDRVYISKIVFRDENMLSRLNALVHPLTRLDAQAWMKKQRSPYAIKEAALIFEAGLENELDYVVGVAAPEDLRIERAQFRDHSTRDQVLERIGKQMDERKKISLCDFVILNDGQTALIPQVLQIHEKLQAINSETNPILT